MTPRDNETSDIHGKSCASVTVDFNTENTSVVRDTPRKVSEIPCDDGSKLNTNGVRIFANKQQNYVVIIPC